MHDEYQRNTAKYSYLFMIHEMLKFERYIREEDNTQNGKDVSVDKSTTLF